MILYEYNDIIGPNEQLLQRVALQDLGAGAHNIIL